MTSRYLLLILFITPLLQSCGKGGEGINASETHAFEQAEIYRKERELEAIRRKVLGTGAVDSSCRYVSSISNRPPAKKVALTFDDGPTRDGTNHVLDVLKKYNIRATFFMQGGMAAAGGSIVQKVVDQGHLLIGNHSYDHANFHELKFSSQKSQIDRTKSILGDFQKQRYFRYPYGNSTCSANKYLHSLGYKIVGWHVDSCDWAFDRSGRVSAKVAKICGVKTRNLSNFVGHVVENTIERNGGIILLHDTHLNTVRQLEEIIDGLIHEGFTFTGLDDPDFAPSMR